MEMTSQQNEAATYNMNESMVKTLNAFKLEHIPVGEVISKQLSEQDNRAAVKFQGMQDKITAV